MCVFLVWYVISFSILESQPSITVVFLAFPMGAGRVHHYPTIAFHCQVSSGSTGFVALHRDEGANSRVSASTVLCSERFLRKNFRFHSRAQEYVDSPVTDYDKARKASRFLEAVAVPSDMLCHWCFFLFFIFFFAPAT